MQWSSEFESGLPDIDNQHRYFFELILRVDVLRKWEDPQNRKRVLDELVNYARCHFDCETVLMRSYGYPEQEKHLEDHALLLKRVTGFLAEEHPNFQKLALFLFNWFSSHTTLDDRPLAAHILARRAETLCVPVDAISQLVSYRP
jgi:hemerythrin-like metal-binding protein